MPSRLRRRSSRLVVRWPRWRRCRAGCSCGAGSRHASAPTRSRRSPHETGIWTLRFLLLTLAVTPLRRLHRLERAHPLPADARPVRVLLRLAAPPHLRRGSTSSSTVADIVEGHREAARSSPSGFAGVRAAGAAGAHVDRRLDPPAGRPRWQRAAPPGLRGGGRRRRALLVAGEGRHLPPPPLRRDRRACCSPRVSRGRGARASATRAVTPAA